LQRIRDKFDPSRIPGGIITEGIKRREANIHHPPESSGILYFSYADD
jgi:hypothetical protein